MKYLDSVVFPYGLCQSGDYIVVANGTVLLSSGSNVYWNLRFMIWHYMLHLQDVSIGREDRLKKFRRLMSDRSHKSL